jgi:hypothetical protein
MTKSGWFHDKLTIDSRHIGPTRAGVHLFTNLFDYQKWSPSCALDWKPHVLHTKAKKLWSFLIILTLKRAHISMNKSVRKSTCTEKILAWPVRSFRAFLACFLIKRAFKICKKILKIRKNQGVTWTHEVSKKIV